MTVKDLRKWGAVATILILGALPGCSDVNSKVAGPGGGPSSGASGSTFRSGGAASGTNSDFSADVSSGSTAPSPR